jgi:hypothetical protein
MGQRADNAYRLTWDLSYIGYARPRRENELEIREFPGSEWMPGLMRTDFYELPDPVIFWGDLQLLNYIDYPSNNMNWPIMSRRMYYVLTSLGSFPHRAIPIALIDSTRFPNEPERCFLANGQPDPNITDFNTLVAVQFLERTNFFSFERSEYELNSRSPGRVKSVNKYALDEPAEGFPSVFRLVADPVILFISAKAREALKESGIRGTAYYPLDSIQSDEVDNPDVRVPADAEIS